MVKGPWTFTRLVFIHCHGGKLFLIDGQFYLSAQILHISFYDAKELKWNVRGQKSRHYERVWSQRPWGFCSCRKAVCSANEMHGHGTLPSYWGPAGAGALHPEPQESSPLADACINQLWELEGIEAGWRGTDLEVTPLVSVTITFGKTLFWLRAGRNMQIWDMYLWPEVSCNAI